MQKFMKFKPLKSGVFWFLALNALFVALAALLWLLLERQWEQGGLEAVDAWLGALAPWFLWVRLGLLSATIGFWPQGIRWLARRYRWPEARKAFMLGLRWRVAAWLAVIELILVQNSHAALVRLLAG
jgi:hypothetical protein